LVQQMMKESIEVVQHFFKERGQDFTSDIASEEMWMDGDPVRLTQIFSNILFNAGKYTAEGGMISLSLEKKDGKAVVKVKDSGIGISKEMVGRIFDAFVQDSKQDGVGTGLGIGLSIAKRLVELHEGTISAASEGEGRGSVFTVELPIHQKRENITE